MINKRKLGKFGEELAKKYLEKNGINVIFQNYFTKWGEIDLIGIENKTIIFTEVKLRYSKRFGEPIESINHKKMQKMRTVIDYFFSNEGYENFDCRIDVICIFYNKLSDEYEINWLKNQYFD